MSARWRITSPFELVLPYLSTPQRLDKPPDDQFLTFCRKKGFPCTYVAKRHAVHNGQDFGLAQIVLSIPPEHYETDGLWLRPYFDPKTKTVELQKRDGSNLKRCKRYSGTLAHLATRMLGRPLLYLAHAEGLIEAVPGKSEIRSSKCSPESLLK